MNATALSNMSADFSWCNWLFAAASLLASLVLPSIRMPSFLPCFSLGLSLVLGLWSPSSFARAAGVEATQVIQASQVSDMAEVVEVLDTSKASEVAVAERGITGTYSFTHADPTLRARVQRDAAARLIVRLQKVGERGEYQARFIGTVEGRYDLGDTLESGSGQPMEELPPMVVRIVSTLPNDQRSDLFEAIGFQPSLTGGYRLVLALAAVTWLAIPAMVYIIRYLRRPAAVEITPPPPAPTIAEQLEPLISAAATRGLSISEQGRLELLLVHYWRERAELPELSVAAAIQRLRLHPEAGPLLHAVERWLHGDDSDDNAVVDELAEGSPAEVLQLLSPYRSSAQLEPQPHGGAAGGAL